MEFQVGQRVLVLRHGVGTIQERRPSPEDQLVVALVDGTVGVPFADAAMFLRDLVTAAEAREHLDRLCSPVETRSAAPLGSYRAFGRMPLEQQLGYVQLLYRVPQALTSLEREIVIGQQDVVLGELAAALDVSLDTLRAAVRRGDPTLRPHSSAPPPRDARLAGHEALGAFSVARELVFGGLEAMAAAAQPRQLLRRAAVGGTWFAFTQSGEAAGRKLLVVVHESAVARVPQLWGEATPLGACAETAQVAFADAEALTDPLFLVDAIDRRQDPGGLLGGRGCAAASNGVGPLQAQGVLAAGKLVLAWMAR